MANWENAPVVEPTEATPPAGAKWKSAPAVGAAQVRYDAAIAKLRSIGSFKDWDDDRFARFAAEKLQPSNAGELGLSSQIFSLGDEVSATSSAVTDQVMKWLGQGGEDFDKSWQAWQEVQSARQELGREQAGAIGTAAEIGGALTSLGASAVAKVPGIVANVVKPLAAAGAEGALYGAGAADGDIGDRLTGAAAGGAIGVAGGAVGASLGKGLEKVIQRGATKEAAKLTPKAAEIKTKAVGGYDAARGTGAVIDPKATNLLLHDVRISLDDAGIILPSGKMAPGYGKVKTALKVIEEYTKGPMTISQALKLRRTVANAADSKSKTERGIGLAMLNQLDDFFEALPPQAFQKGNGPAAVEEMTRAKELYARAGRTGTIEKAIYNAKLAEGGFDNGLRSEFRSILKNDKKKRGFSETELSAMEEFVTGGPVSNFFKVLSGGRGLGGFAFGGMAGGPAGAVALPAAAGLAKVGLGKAAQGEADLIRAAVANGQPARPAVIAPSLAPPIAGASNAAGEDLRNRIVTVAPSLPF